MGFGVVGDLQWSQRRRTRRWAMMPMMLPARMSGHADVEQAGNGADRRVGVQGGHLVAGHGGAEGHFGRFRRRAPRPTRMTSGSWRIIERMPLAKSSLAASATEVWRTSAIGYSTGSSRVMMWMPSLLMWFNTE